MGEIVPPDAAHADQRREVTCLVEEFLEQLPEEQRLMFTLHHFADFRLSEVAEIMECELDSAWLAKNCVTNCKPKGSPLPILRINPMFPRLHQKTDQRLIHSTLRGVVTSGCTSRVVFPSRRGFGSLGHRDGKEARMSYFSRSDRNRHLQSQRIAEPQPPSARSPSADHQ